MCRLNDNPQKTRASVFVLNFSLPRRFTGISVKGRGDKKNISIDNRQGFVKNCVFLLHYYTFRLQREKINIKANIDRFLTNKVLKRKLNLLTEERRFAEQL